MQPTDKMNAVLQVNGSCLAFTRLSNGEIGVLTPTGNFIRGTDLPKLIDELYAISAPVQQVTQELRKNEKTENHTR